MPRLIGLTGLPGHIRRAGKDTTADILIDIAVRRGQSACRRSFADTGKRHLSEILDIPLEELEDFKLTGTFTCDYQDPGTTKPRRVGNFRDTGREFVIRYFQSAKAFFGKDFWVRVLLPDDWHTTRFNGADICIITDLRFEVEIQRLRELGGEVWVIERFEHTNPDAEDEQGFQWQGDEKRINNHGSLEDLRGALETAL